MLVIRAIVHVEPSENLSNARGKTGRAYIAQLKLRLIFLAVGVGQKFIFDVGKQISPDDAKALRRENSTKVLMAGLMLAGLAMIPFANLLVPLFATAFMVHVFKSTYAAGNRRMIALSPCSGFDP